MQTLLLTQGYEPIRVISWQKAITLLTLGKVEIVETYDRDIRSASITFKMPSVARLISKFRRKKKPVKFNRANIYARDRNTCQYCWKTFTFRQLTFDHVIPRSQGGKTSWENIVAACQSCNLRKGGRTPKQSDMQLLRAPKRPEWLPAVTIRVSLQSLPEAWRDYLYWVEELDEED